MKEILSAKGYIQDVSRIKEKSRGIRWNQGLLKRGKKYIKGKKRNREMNAKLTKTFEALE